MNGLPSSANTDANRYKKRSTLSTMENEQLEAMESDRVLQIFKGLSRVFEEPLNQLKEWPFFFENKEAAGQAIQKGFLTLWSTLIIAETLLAGLAIQPFLSNASNMSGWRLEVNGGLWTFTLMLDLLGLLITALFLGYLLGNPSHLAWVWVCKIGPLIGIPVILIPFDLVWTGIAISFSLREIYGHRVGIICAVLAVFTVAAGVAITESFGKVLKEIQALP